MPRFRVIWTCVVAAALVCGIASPAASQMFPADDYDGGPDEYALPPVSRRMPSRRDIEAAYPPPSADEYGDPSRPMPVDPVLRRGGAAAGGYGQGGRASGGDRMLRPDERQTTRQIVEYPTNQPLGTIVVDTRVRKLFYVLGGSRALQYGIGVGREGFAWKGLARVGRKAEWPAWIPPAEMIRRRPELPVRMEGGIENPLGARALYLFKGNADTLFRIHGTNEPESIGQAVSSGCIRMLNSDVVDLYGRIPVGTKVVVL